MPLKVQLRELMETRTNDKGKPLTQLDVAVGTGIPQSTISRYYNGYVTRFDGDIIEKLCDFFGVDPGDLIVRVKE